MTDEQNHVNPLTDTAQRFKTQAPAVDAWTLRLVEFHQEGLEVRQGVLQPFTTAFGRGAMLSVIEGSGMCYAATADLSPTGLSRAARQARWRIWGSGALAAQSASTASPTTSETKPPVRRIGSKMTL